MAKLSDLFGRKNEPGADRFAPRPIAKRDGEPAAYEHFSDVGSRIGEENESLRNLLTDTGRKIGELDELKEAFDKIVTPFNDTLRALEQEKSQTLGLSGMLNESRNAYETLRTEFYQVEKKATSLETESERLHEDLELSREANRGLESTRLELSNDISTQRAQIAEIERQLEQESAQRRTLSENKRTLQEQLDTAEKRTIELEGELAAAREKLALLEDDKHSLQLAVDQAFNETARLTRRLTESENTLTATRAQLGKVEASFAETYSERGRLAAALDETREQNQGERNSLNMRLDALQSRAATAEKLLAEARQNLIARTEEVRAFDRKSVEATIGRNNAEKRLSQIEAAHEARERQIKDLEQSRAALVERNSGLTKTLKTRETALTRAEERIASLSERTGHLEADIQVSRTNIEKRVEDLNTALQRERMERAVIEGALEAARKDNSRLQSEVGALRSALRRGLPLDDAPTAPTTMDGGDTASNVKKVASAEAAPEAKA
jgi:crescentin